MVAKSIDELDPKDPYFEHHKRRLEYQRINKLLTDWLNEKPYKGQSFSRKDSFSYHQLGALDDVWHAAYQLGKSGK
jgi:hypothetical protein